MNKEYFVNWLKAAGMRALKTVAQTAFASMSVASMISEVDFVTVLSTAALAGILSILTSIKGLPELKDSYIPNESEEK